MSSQAKLGDGAEVSVDDRSLGILREGYPKLRCTIVRLAPVVYCRIQFSIVLKSYSTPQSRIPQSQAIAVAAAAPVSHRNLDLCLLAVCSCALTVLCHQAVNLSNTASVSSASSQPSTTLAQVDVSVKSGWFAATQDVSDRDD